MEERSEKVVFGTGYLAQRPPEASVEVAAGGGVKSLF